MIAIIGAMEEEISVVLSETSDVVVEKVANLTFYKAKYKGKELIIVKTGIGMVNSAVVTTLLIEKYKASCIIFSGVAGALSDKIKIGDIVIGNAFVEYQYDLRAFGKKLGHRADTKEIEIKADDKMLELSKNISIDTNIYYGTIASGDAFVEDINRKKEIQNEFNALAIDMESASVAHVCEMMKVPYLIIRSISDSYNDSAKEYDEFIYLASRRSKEFVLEFIGSL